jgi:TPR repeat protein
MKRILAALLLLTLATPAWAGFEEGEAAYERGDHETALREFRPLAEQGNAEAQAALAYMYFFGTGVPQDYGEALNWIGKSAERGFKDAHWLLGKMYAKGLGVPQDYVQAHKWYNLGATLGSKDGAKDRDEVAMKMTPAQIAEAQKLAREWWTAYQKRKGK